MLPRSFGPRLLILKDDEMVWLACANLSGAAFWTDSERANLRTAVAVAVALVQRPVVEAPPKVR